MAINLHIEIALKTKDSDFQDVYQITQELFDELDQLDSIEGVEFEHNDIHTPEDTKGGLALGGIIAKLIDANGLASIVSVFQSWLSRDKDRLIKLKIGDNSIEVNGLSRSEQENLINWFKQQTAFKWSK